MKISTLAQRYARAVYELAVDNKSEGRVLDDLRAISAALTDNPELLVFLTNPLVGAKERVEALSVSLEKAKVAKEAKDLLLLLARRDRIGIFKELVGAFEQQADLANRVCRGVVRSAVALSQDERNKIEQTVERALNKKVILTYKIDPTVLGGLVAQVGSYTFDDTISTHMRRLKEELNRRTV